MLIGRKKEIETLKKALYSNEAEMISVIGRRRVGKTFLVRTVYEGLIDFEVSGTQHATMQEQLGNFAYLLNAQIPFNLPIQQPSNWLEAFQLLISFLEQKPKQGKWVLFFDELPWLATHRSGFLKGLDFFWNNWAVKKNIVVVVCGSAASWMIQKVVQNKGGLYNRITRRIFLEPFNLAETKQFFKSKNLNVDHYQIIQMYMAFGGIPHYLKVVEKGESASQSIERVCFKAGGLLHDEFQQLYPALFDHADNHIAIIRALASKWKGLTRKEIMEATKFTDGGGTTKVIEELASSGFITPYWPFGKKKKDVTYQLSDEYSLFYLTFMEKQNKQKGSWELLSQTQLYKSWSGYAFESLCMKHVQQIKKALGITGIYSEAATYYSKGSEGHKGVQVDLLIDRNDHAINLFEIKFYNAPFSLTKSSALGLRGKIHAFREATKTKKQIFPTFITTFGLEENEHSLGLVDKALDMDILFEEN